MRIDRRTALLGSLAVVGAASGARAQFVPATPPGGDTASVDMIELWPGGAPGGPTKPLQEKVNERSPDTTKLNDRAVLGISKPRMIAFRPARPTGASVLITPGGGYRHVVVDKEGFEMARWLNARGITAFVLFYRLPHEGWSDRSNTPLADAQRAMRLIRHNAPGWKLDPAKVGAMGFSAGGHLCADLLARFDAPVYAPVDDVDRLSARPDGAAPIYPVVSMTEGVAHMGSRANLIGEDADAALEHKHAPHLNVQSASPPTFLLHAEDDATVPVENTILLREALRAKGVAVETHLYPDGGHGFGLRLARGKSVENWPELFLAWGRYQGLFA